MNKKRFLALALAFVMLFAVLTGCGSKSHTETAVSEEAMQEPKAEDNLYGGFNDSAAPEAINESADSKSDNVLRDAKLIITADIMLETTEFDKSQNDIDALVTKNGGYFEKSAVSSGSYYSKNDIRDASFVIRVPKESYKKFLNQISETCHVVNKSETAEDIGEIYFDKELRLKTQKTKQERLLKLLEKAEKMEDIISLETALSEVQYQIEQYTSELKKYDNLVDFVTINVSLQEVRKLTDTDSEREKFIPRLQRAIVGGFETAKEVIEEFILSLAYSLPMLLVLLAGFVVVVIFVRNRQKAFRRKKEEQKQIKDDKENKEE